MRDKIHSLILAGMSATALLGWVSGFYNGSNFGRNQSIELYKFTGVRSCEVEGQNYVILDNKYDSEIYFKRIDGSYILLSDMISLQRQEILKNIEDKFKKVGGELVEFENKNNELEKRIEEAAGPKMKTEMEGSQ